MKKPLFTYYNNEDKTYTIFKNHVPYLDCLQINEDEVLYLVSILNSNYHA